MAAAHVKHPTLDERRARGEEAGNRTPIDAHRGWSPAADRPDPVALLEEQDRTRDQDLVPVRHGRMMVSPFTFYRGAAAVMAADLADTPTAGLTVQLCGDAHLSNFGAFASPERRLLFDVNDFDETLPGPFEYDVERLAASFTIAAQNNGFTSQDAKTATLRSVSAYREAMHGFAQMRTMNVWYASLDADQILAAVRTSATAKHGKKELARTKHAVVQAHSHDSLQALASLAAKVDGQYRIVSQPPIVVPMRDLAATYGISPDDIEPELHEQLRAYRSTLPEDFRQLLERFQVVDTARKVVGVGSVGTRCFVALLQGRDDQDPLFLQVKEATSSVLEAHLPKSRFRQHGERVVQGQRLMQAASDVFLGWTVGRDPSRHYYWRQLRDMKESAEVDQMTADGMTDYARMCGWTLARAHARSGDPVAIAEYLGDTDAFDHAIVNFAKRYADQNERDYQAFKAAIDSGRLQAIQGM
jgi:uncharacterized protein (DUF2252 family)